MNADAVPPRKTTEVAVGVLLRADGAVLLADRPAGKPYAGYWEFPGGKIEPGESVAAALARELDEELGIAIGPALPWVTFEFDYPHAYVRLHFCRVRQWRGEPAGREGQHLGFFDPAAAAPAPLLPAAVPALRWLGLPDFIAELRLDVAQPDAAGQALAAAAAAPLRMLLLRADARRPPAAQTALARQVVAQARARRVQVIVDAVLASGTAADGVQQDLAALTAQAPALRPAQAWLGADAGAQRPPPAALTLASGRGCDYACVGAAWEEAGAPAAAPAPPLPVYVRGRSSTLATAAGELAQAQARGAHGLLLPLTAWR